MVEPYLQRPSIQAALKSLLMSDAALVIGGYNSTNSSDINASANTTMQSPLDKVFIAILSVRSKNSVFKQIC